MRKVNDEALRAFPKTGAVYSQGMLLRDYIATAALNGMLASDSSVDRTKVNKRVWAKVAYDFADAMMKVRSTPNTTNQQEK